MKTSLPLSLAVYLALALTAVVSNCFSQTTETSFYLSFGRYAATGGGCSGGRGVCSFNAGTPLSRNAVLKDLGNNLFELTIFLDKLSEIDKQKLLESTQTAATTSSRFLQEESVIIPNISSGSADAKKSSSYKLPAGNFHAQKQNNKLVIQFQAVQNAAP